MCMLCVLCVCIYVSRCVSPFAKVTPLTPLGCICDATLDVADVPLSISDAIWQWETRHVLPMLLGQPPKQNLPDLNWLVPFLHSNV